MPYPWSAGNVLTATDLNSALAAKAALASPTFTGTPALPAATTVGGDSVFGAWPGYAPTLTNVTVGDGTLDVRSRTIGKIVHVRGLFSFGATSAFAATPRFGLPVTPLSGAWVSGGCYFVDSSTGFDYEGGISNNRAGSPSADEVTFIYRGGGEAADGRLAAAVPFTWAAGDILTWFLTYERA